jgi:hypothetical protein
MRRPQPQCFKFTCVGWNDEATDFPKREKKPAVLTAAMRDPVPMATPASAASDQGVGPPVFLGSTGARTPGEGGGVPAAREAIVPSGATDAAVRRFVKASDGAVTGGADSGNAEICGCAVIRRTS